MLNSWLDIPVKSGIYRVTKFHGISEKKPHTDSFARERKFGHLGFFQNKINQIRCVSNICFFLLVHRFVISKIPVNIPFYAPGSHDSAKPAKVSSFPKHLSTSGHLGNKNALQKLILHVVRKWS